MSDLVERARKFAEQPLMARLTVDGDYDKRTMLKSRIAGIRAGTMDNAPEVQSALIALTTFESELAAAKAREEKLARGLRLWLEWYRMATADDDCQYLNGKGWDDAEANASTTIGLIAALADMGGGDA